MLRAQLDLRVAKAYRVQQVRKAYKANRVYRVMLDQLGLQEQLAIRAQLDRLDPRAQIQR